MDCEIKSCHMYDICRLKEIAEKCSIHKHHMRMKVLEMSGLDSSAILEIEKEESVKDYVKRIEKTFPELAKDAEKNARELLDLIRKEQ